VVLDVITSPWIQEKEKYALRPKSREQKKGEGKAGMQVSPGRTQNTGRWKNRGTDKTLGRTWGQEKVRARAAAKLRPGNSFWEKNVFPLVKKNRPKNESAQ